MNILANAIDAFDEASQEETSATLPSSSSKIIIRTEQLLTENQAEEVVQIRIQDNGMGIPEAVRAKIFDHLFTTKAVGKGTGLGLSISRRIIEEKHGGTIQCDSTIGQGTEFVIALPKN